MFKKITFFILILLFQAQPILGMKKLDKKNVQEFLPYFQGTQSIICEEPVALYVQLPEKEFFSKSMITFALKEFCDNSNFLDLLANKILSVSEIEQIKSSEIEKYVKKRFEKSPFKCFEMPHIQFELEDACSKIIDYILSKENPEAKKTILIYRKQLSKIFLMQEKPENLDEMGFYGYGIMPNAEKIKKFFSENQDLKKCTEKTFVIQELANKRVLPVHIKYAEELMLLWYFLQIKDKPDKELEKIIKTLDTEFAKAVSKLLDRDNLRSLKKAYQEFRVGDNLIKVLIPQFLNLKKQPKEKLALTVHHAILAFTPCDF